MNRYIALAIAVAIAYAVTHRPAVGCALVAVAAGLDHAGAALIPEGRRDPIARLLAHMPPLEPPLDMRERIEDRMLDTWCRACPERRRANERWLP